MSRVPAAVRRLLVPGVVECDLGREGQWVTDDHVVQLGTRLGPIRFDLQALLHEMSHLVEIDDRRVLQIGWGLRIKTVVRFMGREYPEPVTRQAIDRECRVLAFQSNLQVAVGRSPRVNGWVRAMRYVAGYCYVPGETDTARDRWVAAEVARLRALPAYSFEAFQREWRRKVGVIQRRQARRRGA